MIKQKRGFLLFLASLVPGAGEMYMGFRKQGVSIMTLFFALFVLGTSLRMPWLWLFLPVLWFYSFFNVHNLKALSEEEFYQVEDSFVLNLGRLFGDAGTLITRFPYVIAVFLIILGISILGNVFSDMLYWILPYYISNIFGEIAYALPQFIIAGLLIAAGVYLIMQKHRSLNTSPKQAEEEHYWEPYRPYQQNDQAQEFSEDPVPQEDTKFQAQEPAPFTEQAVPQEPAQEAPLPESSPSKNAGSAPESSQN